MEQLSPVHPPPQSSDEGAKEQKTRHFDIIEMGGGVVQMFHLYKWSWITDPDPDPDHPKGTQPKYCW